MWYALIYQDLNSADILAKRIFVTNPENIKQRVREFCEEIEFNFLYEPSLYKIEEAEAALTDFNIWKQEYWAKVRKQSSEKEEQKERELWAKLKEKYGDK